MSQERLDFDAPTPDQDISDRASLPGYDADGLLIDDTYKNVPHKWAKLPYSLRKRLSEYQEEHNAKMAAKKPKQTRINPGTYTTQYAVDECRRRKWRIVDRERYDARLKRHHDLMLGMDLIVDDGGKGLLLIQAAGKGERASHWRKFIERGGTENALRLGVRVLYWVFERHVPSPIEEEKWVE